MVCFCDQNTDDAMHFLFDWIILDKNEQTGPTGTKRPAWCIFGKQNQNVETLLFKGKFYDWPGDLKELKPVNDAAHSVNRIPSARRVRLYHLIQTKQNNYCFCLYL